MEALDRSIKTMAAAMVAVLGTNVIGVTDVHWIQTFNIGAFAAIVSILTSLATAKPPTEK